MSGIIWVLIPLVAIVGAYIIDYQKNKLKWQAENNKSDEELNDLRKLMQQMKKRIENLEAIAAGEPEEFSRMHNKTAGADPLGRIELDDRDIIKKENEKRISTMAKTKGEM